MPRKNISDMLHRSVAGAVLFSICHFAAAEAERIDFWGLTSPTYDSSDDESSDKFWNSLSTGTPNLVDEDLSLVEWSELWNIETSEPLRLGFINKGVESALLTFSSLQAPIKINRELVYNSKNTLSN